MENRERKPSLAKSRLHALCRVVCCFVAAIPVLAEDPPATVWEGVQARAAASGDPQAEDRRKVSEKCGEILKTATDGSLRTQTAKPVRELERIAADAGD